MSYLHLALHFMFQITNCRRWRQVYIQWLRRISNDNWNVEECFWCEHALYNTIFGPARLNACIFRCRFNAIEGELFGLINWSFYWQLLSSKDGPPAYVIIINGYVQMTTYKSTRKTSTLNLSNCWGCSARKWYLQARGKWKNRDFTSGGIEKGDDNCH